MWCFSPLTIQGATDNARDGLRSTRGKHIMYKRIVYCDDALDVGGVGADKTAQTQCHKFATAASVSLSSALLWKPIEHLN